jgi:hypothetical protein
MRFHEDNLRQAAICLQKVHPTVHGSKSVEQIMLHIRDVAEDAPEGASCIETGGFLVVFGKEDGKAFGEVYLNPRLVYAYLQV